MGLLGNRHFLSSVFSCIHLEAFLRFCFRYCWKVFFSCTKSTCIFFFFWSRKKQKKKRALVCLSNYSWKEMPFWPWNMLLAVPNTPLLLNMYPSQLFWLAEVRSQLVATLHKAVHSSVKQIRIQVKSIRFNAFGMFIGGDKMTGRKESRIWTRRPSN